MTNPLTNPLETFTRTLQAVRNDDRAVAALAVEYTAVVPQWIDRSECELRCALGRGEVDRGRDVGELITSVLRARVSDREVRLHREGLGCLLAAIQWGRQGNTPTALRLLERVRQSEEYALSFRWLAQLWIGQVQARAGDTDSAEEEFGEARRMARNLDPRAEALADCYLARFEAAQGEIDQARERLGRAQRIFDRAGDRSGLAIVWLCEAELLAIEEVDEEEDEDQAPASIALAFRALTADPRWSGPALFLARAAVARGDIDEAELRLRSVPANAEVKLLLGLLGWTRRGELPLWVIAELMSLREQPASESVLGQYRALVKVYPMPVLREALAWTMVHMGFFDDAEREFTALLTEASDPDVRASGVVGLASVATARQPVGTEAQEMLKELDRWVVCWTMGLLDEDGGSRDAPAWLGRGYDVPRLVRSTPATGTIAVGDFATGEGDRARQRKVRATAQTFAPAAPVAEAPSDALATEVFSGDLRTLNVAQLLEFFRATRRTGALLIHAKNGDGALRLNRGNIVAARAPGCASLVEMLVAEGRVIPSQLQLAEARQGSTDRCSTIGATLIELGFVGEPVMRDTLHRQVLQAVRVMMEWHVGRFAFRPHVEWLVKVEGHAEIDPQNLLFDLAAGDA